MKTRRTTKAIVGAFAQLVLAGFIGSMAPPVVAAPTTLLVEGGVLVGAKNVVVNGLDYDVEFVDGSCATVYGQCSASAFGFDYDVAVNGSWALLESVFIDSSAGAFDSQPFRIRGCVHEPMNFGYPCIVYSAGLIEPGGLVVVAAAINQPSPSQYGDGVIGNAVGVGVDYTSDVTTTWAVWHLSTGSASLPEPRSLALAFSAFGAVVAVRRRRTPAIL